MLYELIHTFCAQIVAHVKGCSFAFLCVPSSLVLETKERGQGGFQPIVRDLFIYFFSFNLDVTQKSAFGAG